MISTKLPGSSVVIENDNIDLTCVSDGWPKAEITWYKGDVQLLDDGSKYAIQKSDETLRNGCMRMKSVLTLLEVKRDAAGRYTCKAKNIVNSAESSTDLVVRCKYISAV